ncbi:MAG: hypothetical protein KDA41_06030 [Planctomycetales bacterium]|nr:hypothetical protein [Planctomycetales bacterium]
MLHCDVTSRSGVSIVALPEPLRADWDGQATLQFCSDANAKFNDENGAPQTLHAAPSSELFRWAMRRLQAQGAPIAAMPRRQPQGVAELAPALFAPFQFADGHIHLAGCALEDRPIVRATFASTDGQDDDDAALAHYFAWRDGSPVDEASRGALGLDDLEPWRGRVAPHDAAELRQTVDVLRAQGAGEFVAATIIWCKYATGKIAFSAGEEIVEVPFAGWAKPLADGITSPPKFRCPHSQIETYAVDVDDDGRIAAAEAIVRCECTGRKTLASETGVCAASGKRVLLEQLQTCGATGDAVLADEMATCSQCQQRVSPSCLEGQRCAACRNLAPVRKDDPRMARLLDEYPRLDRWPRWKLSEAPQVYVLLASSWLRQLLLVVDKETLKVKHLAGAGRLWSAWQEVAPVEWEEWLE